MSLDYEYLSEFTPAFSDFVDLKHWTVYTSNFPLLFDFNCSLIDYLSSVLLASSAKTIKSSCFAIDNLLCIFGTAPIFFKRLEGVISTGKVTEGSIIFRVLLNEGPAGIGNTLGELVPEDVVQVGAIFGGAVSTELTASLVSKWKINIQALWCG